MVEEAKSSAINVAQMEEEDKKEEVDPIQAKIDAM